MHDLKELRKNLDSIKKFEHRNLNFDVANFNKIDSLNRDLINKKEKLEQEKFCQSQKISLIWKKKKFLEISDLLKNKQRVKTN